MLTNDNELLTSETIEKLYEDTIDSVYRFFYFKCLSKSIAEDLTSDTYFRFLELAKRAKIHNPRSYLFGVARIIFQEYLHNKYRIPITPFDIDDERNDVAVEDFINTLSSNRQRVKYILNLSQQLPSSQKFIVHKILKEQLTTKQICKKYKKSEDYVNTTRKRAVKSLKKLLECTPYDTNILKKK